MSDLTISIADMLASGLTNHSWSWSHLLLGTPSNRSSLTNGVAIATVPHDGGVCQGNIAHPLPRLLRKFPYRDWISCRNPLLVRYDAVLTSSLHWPKRTQTRSFMETEEDGDIKLFRLINLWIIQAWRRQSKSKLEIRTVDKPSISYNSIRGVWNHHYIYSVWLLN